MKQVQTITWIPFNADSKPDHKGFYLIQLLEDEDRESNMDCNYYNGDDFIDYPDEVIAFAEKPQGYDPTATIFNFMTALEMMKDTDCKSLASGKVYFIFASKFMEITNPCGGRVGTFKDLSLAEITGLWEEA